MSPKDRSLPEPPFVASRDIAAEPSVAELEQAQAFLSQLGEAMFGATGGRPEQLTWDDKPSAVEPTASGQAPGIWMLERRLWEAEQRFRTLIEQIPAVTFMAVLGEGRNEVYVSPHIETMLGYTQEEWLADPFLWYTRLHQEDRKVWNDEFARGCSTGGPFRAECRFMSRKGDVVWVHGEAHLVKDERGRPQFLQGVAFDITESKRAQAVVLEHAVNAARVEEELLIAHELQRSILPPKPALSGLELAATMRAAERVGGDYFDVRPSTDGGWIAIGDVSGHGLRAGLVMLMLQSAVAALTDVQGSDASPAQILGHLNEVLYENVRDRMGGGDYVTFCLLRYFEDGRLLFAGAHLPILIFRTATGTVERIDTSGVWLGVCRNIALKNRDQLLTLHPGDILVLYSDGLIEAANDAGDPFDLERLRVAIERLRDAAASDIRDGIVQEVLAFTAVQEDDITLLVARYHGAR